MIIRSSTLSDVSVIMRIIKDAQTHLAQQKIDQWQNGYPSLEIINNDIIKGNSYVIIDTKEETIATTMFTIQPEPTYTKIEGQWLRPVNEKYGVIHRLAIKASKRNQGIAKAIFKHFESVLINNSIPSMKVDTHRGNLGMQHMLKSIGYTYCGIIYLEDGNERFGFEKILEQ